MVKDYEGGKKVAPDITDAGQVRLGAGLTGAAWRDETAIGYSGWWTGASVPDFYFNYQTYIYDFTAVDTTMSVWIEVRSTYPRITSYNVCYTKLLRLNLYISTCTIIIHPA